MLSIPLRRLSSTALAVCLLWTDPVQAIPVFDVTNYAQNALQAARGLEQINNQIRSLQNEALMLDNMAKNLEHLDFSSLTQLSQDLGAIGQLVKTAQGISFQLDTAQKQFAGLFAAGVIGTSTEAALANTSARVQAVQAAWQHSVAIQSQISTSAQNDGASLSSLIQKSQAADGSLQASQVTNQLLALVAKQQAALQQLLAAEGRAQSVQQSSDLQSTAEAQAATRRFLGSGQNYHPQ
jgi:type IV secretion system protein TrbJ